jgi:hypothetical protein
MVCGAMKHREVVKRAYVELRERAPYLKRLAFWTNCAEEAAEASELFHLTGSKAEDIDVVMTVDDVDVEPAPAPPRVRRSFPLPLRLNRLAVALCVLILGICGTLIWFRLGPNRHPEEPIGRTIDQEPVPWG